jgi:hypothetical protein
LERKFFSYQNAISEIEQGIASRMEDDQIHPEALKAALQGQYDLFIALSKKVAILHDRVAKEKQDFESFKRLTDVANSSMDMHQGKHYSCN